MSTITSATRWQRPLCTLIVACSLLIGGCASNQTKLEQMSQHELYQAAKSAMRAGDYNRAVDNLEMLEARFPFGDYSIQGQLELIYSYYRADRPNEAISAANRFQKLNPNDDNIDYTLYIQGVTEFERYAGMLDSFIPRNPSKFGNSEMQRPYQYLHTLVSRYPNSRYSADAKRRLLYLRNQMAKACMRKVEFYQERKAYLSALLRATTCLQSYDGAPAVEHVDQLINANYAKLGFKARPQ